MLLRRTLLVGCILLGCLAALSMAVVHENSFTDIKNDKRQSVVVFYYSSNPEHMQKLEIIRQVSDKVSNELPQLTFQSCDGDLEVNKAEYKDAGFNGGFYVFTQIDGQGIEKYTHEVSEEMLTKHLRNLFAPYNTSDVQTFVDEDTFYEELDSDPSGRPIVVKFFENWCTHCRAFKRPFNIAATKFKNKARFLEVECSKNDLTRQFCAKHDARAFPVVKIFSPEGSAKFELESRSVINVEKFIDTFIQSGGKGTAPAPSRSTSSGPSTSASKPQPSQKAQQAVPRSTLADTPNRASLYDQASLVERVASLERALEALTIRLENVEKRK